MNTRLCAIRIETLGCRLNQAEAESFAALCAGEGFSIYADRLNYTGFTEALGKGHTTIGVLSVSSAGGTDTPMRFFTPVRPENTVLCFVNTCTVTGKAEQKARRLIRLLTKDHPHAVILVTGCYAQLEAAEIEAIHPHVLAFPGRQKGFIDCRTDLSCRIDTRKLLSRYDVFCKRAACLSCRVNRSSTTFPAEGRAFRTERSSFLLSFQSVVENSRRL